MSVFLQIRIWYSLASILGAFVAVYALIPWLGHNRAFLVTPICCVVSAGLFFCVSNLGKEDWREADGGGDGAHF